MSVARFTTPAGGGGVYAIEAMFYGVTSDTTGVSIVVNGSPVFSSTHAGFGIGNEVGFSQSITLDPNDTVEFVVGNGGNGYLIDWVGVDATLALSPAAAVPEPASVGLLVAGATGLVAFRRRAGRHATARPA